MHESVAETGKWLKSVVQGYFNYHAVPGNTDCLRALRWRVTRVAAGSDPSRPEGLPELGANVVTVGPMIPIPRVLHPYPEFALTPFIRDKSLMRQYRPWGSVPGVSGDRYPYRDPDTGITDRVWDMPELLNN